MACGSRPWNSGRKGPLKEAGSCSRPAFEQRWGLETGILNQHTPHPPWFYPRPGLGATGLEALFLFGVAILCRLLFAGFFFFGFAQGALWCQHWWNFSPCYHSFLPVLFIFYFFILESESVHTQAGNGGRQGPRETERTPSRHHPPHRARRGVWSHDPGSWPELKSRVERSTDRATQASVPSCFVLNSGIVIITFHEFLCISGFLTLSFSFFPTELRKQKSSVKICYR